MADELSIVNPKPQKLPGPQLLHEILSGHGDSTAIEHHADDGTIIRLDYRELHGRADALARRISTFHSTSGPNPRRRLIVPILIPQCADLYVSQLAILKAGRAFCPLALDIPEERLRFILRDVDAGLLLTTSDFIQKLPLLEGVQILAVDDFQHDNTVRTDATSDIPVTPQQAAYIMYTSGSTGQPKGVVLSHSAATQALLAHDRHIPQFARFLQFASPTFDVSVFEIFFPWLRGRTLVSCDRKLLLNDLPATISRLQVDAAELTPSVASSLLRNRENAPSLKVLLTIGEMLKPGVVEEFGGSADAPGILHGMYGPTEAVIHCTLRMNFPKDLSCGNIGVPLDTVSAFVIKPLDADGFSSSEVEILPQGAEGELAIGGYQLADGYLNRDEQTKAVFVEHPEFGPLYRTGDLARVLPDGSLECLGRIAGGQVKLRGQRIELGEIEHSASNTDGIEDVVAEVVSGILVVFCTRSSEAVTTSSVTDTCRKWLPAFMVPGDVVFLECMPYLASGKLDRKRLKAEYGLSNRPTDTDASREGPVSKIIEILGLVLRTDIQETSSLPALGLDSLSAIRVASALRKAGFAQIDASQVLLARFPSDIADLLETTDAVPAALEHHDIGEIRDSVHKQVDPRDDLKRIEDVFPCTAVQAAMLVETAKDSQAYCNWIELLVPGIQDLRMLHTALAVLCEKHQMLRSGFVVLQGPNVTSHAVVVWRSVPDNCVKETVTFEHSFTIGTSAAMLHPLDFQIRHDGEDARIILRIHHALYDHWSIDVFRADLAALLRGDDIGTPAQFRSVSIHHNQHLADKQSFAAVDFWQDHLRDFAPSRLPQLSAKRLPAKLCRTRWRDLDVQTSHLRSRAKDLQCAGPAVFQAALVYLLSTYTGVADVTIGSVFSGRNIAVPDVEMVFGPCLTTLPFRLDLSSAYSCQDLLSAVTNVNRAMQRNSLVPLSSVKQAAGVAPGVALFDTLFVWQESSLPILAGPDAIRVVDTADHLEFNLVIEFEPSPTCVRARATYQQNLISAEQVGLLLYQIDEITQALISPDAGLVDELALKLPADLLSVSNPDPCSLTNGVDLVQAIETRATECSDRQAILFASDLQPDHTAFTSISYRRLNALANKMAYALLRSGLRPGDVVCICMEKSIELYVAILASLKAGAGYLPLVPETPTARIQSVLEQAHVKLCVCDAETSERFNSLTSASIVNVATLDTTPYPETAPPVIQNGSRTAYAVFTSGSTGTPKGVAVTADNLQSNLAALAKLYAVQPGDRLLQACSQAFDVSVFEIFFAFYSGMCLCSATKNVLFRDLEQSIGALEVTHLSLTPTVAALVTPASVQRVKFLVTAGEGVSESVHRTWAGHGLHQGYGPSETTNICSVNMNMAQNDAIGNIGRPFENTSAFVVRPSGDFQLVPSGAYGEFVFGGEQVFRGYIGLDQLNAEKIIEHSVYGRVYRSGDMGRILHDGTLLISGRLDDQVKIRGNRVELGEINAVILQHSQVSDCATLVMGTASADQALVSFWVPISVREAVSAELTVVQCDQPGLAHLFHSLESALPAYMVPSMLVPISRMPLTLQGKLDKRRLAAIFDALDVTQRKRISGFSDLSTNDAPADQLEKSMADALAQTLGISPSAISRNTSFFALGLNSLNVINFAKALEAKGSKFASVSAILKNPSIARLRRPVPQHSSEGATEVAPDIQTVFPQKFLEETASQFAKDGQDVESILPCTPLQEAMLSATSDTTAGSYCNITEIHVVGDIAKLRDCWATISERHAILRTRFVPTPLAAHTFAQVVLRSPPLPWSTSEPAANGHTGQDRLPITSTSNPFEITFQESKLRLYMHHAVYDGISMSNLFTEVERLYHGETLPMPVSFAPFLALTLAHNGQRALNFWKSKLSGFHPHPLPQHGVLSDDGEATITRTLTVEHDSLGHFCERHSLTPLSVFEAAWVKVLACAQSIEDVCFGNVVSGRSVSIAGVGRLVAPCFNTIPVRTKSGISRTNLDLAKQLHEANIDTLGWQLTALRRLQTLSEYPAIHLFDSLLLVQAPHSDLDPNIWVLKEERGDMNLPLVIEVVLSRTGYQLRLHFSSSAVSQSMAEDLAAAFDSAIVSCVRFASSRPDHFLDYDASRISGRLASSNTKPITQRSGGNPNGLTDSWTPEEDLIRQTFASLAGIAPSQVLRQTTLYQVGLDSLNAVQVASRLRKLGLKVDAADVMQYSSPAALASQIASKHHSSDREEATFDLSGFEKLHKQSIIKQLKLESGDIEAVRPCTPAQSGMLAQSLQSHGKLYVNHITYLVPASKDEKSVQEAWAKVQRKHQILRTGFAQIEDASYPFAMVVYQANSCPAREDTTPHTTDVARLEALATREMVDHLDLPAWRFTLLDSDTEKKMCLSIHHALYDADSLKLLLTDFQRALRSQDLGPTTSLDSILINTLQGTASEKSDTSGFWSNALKGARLVKFPSLTPTVVATGSLQAMQRKSHVSTEQLERHCKKLGVTIQALGQSAWARLLAAYLGEPTVTFGTVFSSLISTQNIAFPNITTIPVVCETGKDSIGVVRDMLSYNATAQRHRFTPLAEIQRLAGNPGQALFDTVFVYQKPTICANETFDWPIVRETAAVDYVLSMEIETTDYLNTRLTFDTKHIPEAHASLILDQYDFILQQLLDQRKEVQNWPKELLSALPPAEAVLPSPVRLLHEFLERRAVQHPNKPALEFIDSFDHGEAGRRIWTYRELDHRCNQVAHLIQRCGIEPGSVVAVCMAKSAQASFAFVGILKAGCAFLAMDPDLPTARRSFIVEDSQSRLLFLDEGRKDSEMHVQQIELTEQALDHLPTSPISIPPVDPDATSYIIYTSGTTGTPKGCILSHENAVQAMMAFQRLFAGHWTEASRWLQFASYWFDVSVLEQFWSWGVGITVVGAPRDLVLEDLPGFIQTADITHLDLTPALARLVTPQDAPSLCKGVFITGGESLKQEIIDAWGRENVQENVLCNGWGPSESCVGNTMNRFLGPDARPSNIGPQFANVGSFVLVPGTDEPVLRGAVGELCVSGKLVGKGYLNRPDLTQRAFPFLERYGERVYRTGDLVRMLADGSFSFIGRQDTQAKLRGQRLEIDEIVSIIRSSSDKIWDATCLVIKRPDGKSEVLVGFVVPNQAEDKALQVLSSPFARGLVGAADQACRQHLPGYMVPTHIIATSRLPLTVNNKVDTKSLTRMFSAMDPQDLQRLKGPDTSERAMTNTEKQVAKVLCRLLSIDQNTLTPQSNTFSAGLSSVSAINFTTMLKRSGFKSCTMATIMSNPTLERLAIALTRGHEHDHVERDAIQQAKLALTAFQQRFRNTSAQMMHVDVADIENLAPCTPLQQGLLVESTKSADRPYFNHFRYEMDNGDLARLESALKMTFNSIPMLRTVFLRTEQGFIQAVSRICTLTLRTVSLPSDQRVDAHIDEQSTQWVGTAEEDVLRPFQVLIVCLPSRLVLVMFAHHALYDGISWDLTMERVAANYQGHVAADYGPSFFDALPHGPLKHRPDAEQFWKARIGDTRFQTFPESFSEQPSKVDPVVTRMRSINEGLESARRHLGISHQALFQACFALALHQHAPQTQSYGVVLSGRSIAFDGAERVIGPMFNTVPYAVDLDSDDTWTSYLQRSHEVNAAILPYQHTSLRDIRKFCRRPPGDSMFDALFVFQSQQEESSSLKDAGLKATDSQVSPDFLVAFEVELDPSGNIAITAVAQRARVSQDALAALVHDFERALDGLSHNSAERISATFNITQASRCKVDQAQVNSVPHTNGVAAFRWTEQAVLLRESIAHLAGCDITSVTEYTTIYALGLDSIDAVRLASRIKRAGLTIPVSTILKTQTIPKMLEQTSPTRVGPSHQPETRKVSEYEKQLAVLRETLPGSVDVERILPATSSQDGLIAEMLRSSCQEYYNHDILQLSKDTDLERIKSAWQAVVDASPIFRTSFVEVEAAELDVAFAQVVHKPATLKFDEVSATSIQGLNTHLEAIRKDALQSIGSRSPLRLTLVTIADNRYFVLSLAHAQYDGHSLALFHEDVRRAYHRQLEPRPSYIETIDMALNATSEDATSFWRNMLASAKVSYLDTYDGHQSTEITHRAERTCSVSLKDVRSLCRRVGVSVQALAQTAWALTLAHTVHSLDVVYGLVLACRDSEQAEQVMFPTMNTIPFRTSLHGSGTQMLQYVQGVVNDMREFQRTPLRTIQTACSPVVENATLEHGLFDSLFIYQQRSDMVDEHQTPLYESVEGTSSVDYPLAVELENVGASLFVRAAAKSRVMDKRGTRELLKRLDHVIDMLVNSPDRNVVEFTGSGKVSICGLPSFQLPTQDQISQLDGHGVDAEVEGDEEADSDSSLALAIRTALSVVAKVPVDEITLNATIESIGIDSISAIKVTSLLRKQSIKLPVSDILKARSLKQMTRLAEANSQPTQKTSTCSEDTLKAAMHGLDLDQIYSRAGVSGKDVDIVMPATAGQIYMLSMWQRTGGQLFHPVFSYHLKTQRNVEEITQAWKATVAGNALLRTIFLATGVPGLPLLQVVLKNVADPSTTTRPMVSLDINKIVDSCALKLKIHHALYDAVSLPLLMHDLQSRILGSQPPAPNARFEDFIASSLTPASTQSRRDFWTTYLHDVQAIKPPQSTTIGAQKRVELFRGQYFTRCDDLERLARKEGVTSQALLFAICARASSTRPSASKKAYQAQDAILGVYLSNRARLPDLDSLAAPTLNLVPLRIRAVHTASLLDMAKAIQQDLRKIGTAENADVALWEIERWTGVTVDTFVNFLKLPERNDEDDQVGESGITEVEDGRVAERSRVLDVEAGEFVLPKELEGLKGVESAYQHTVDFEITVADGRLSLGLFCPEEMLGIKDAEEMVEKMKRLLEALVGLTD